MPLVIKTTEMAYRDNLGNYHGINAVGEDLTDIKNAISALDRKTSIDTTAEWSQKITYIPIKGEIVIYSDRNIIGGINYPGIKIGDGNSYVVDLPFLGDDAANEIIGIINGHINNTVVHISSEDRSFWNEKLNYEIDNDNETLKFTRN